jgi:hypothetical protein
VERVALLRKSRPRGQSSSWGGCGGLCDLPDGVVTVEPGGTPQRYDLGRVAALGAYLLVWSGTRYVQGFEQARLA